MWADSSDEDDRQYKVVVNQEEQYSIWPSGKDNAPGWRDAGKDGSKQECLAHIQAVWTDLRPAGLRRHLDALAEE
ncbi:MbtH family NRPS accessory protein [Kitasatospora sp. NPDC048540]|uniref:MbtH family protein n=1 Tax=unclassified Kitasatospora TaxID=2633591 RepID=UPI000A7BBF80